MQTETAILKSPFLDAGPDATEEELAVRARNGDRNALELLLTRHLPWIFNFSIRMLHRRADAEDATQEILLKLLKALPGFRGEAKFRTWLYRIAFNHLLNVSKSKWNSANAICSFAQASNGLRMVPDLDLPDPSTVPVPVELLVEETKTNCMMGTLLCLDGRQRLVFILGEIFNVSDTVGAGIAEVTPANFRQILSRARRDLYQYLRDNCSLVNSENTCKCARKTQAFIKAGYVDPRKLEFTGAHTRKVREIAARQASGLHEAYMEIGASVYRNHPFYEPREQAEILRRAIESFPIATNPQ